MPDQKPTLDYGRPDPPKRHWVFDVTMSIGLGLIGIVTLSLGLLGTWKIFDGPDGILNARDVGEVVFLIGCGLLSLWLVWKISKPR